MAEQIGPLCIPSSQFFPPQWGEEDASDSLIQVAYCEVEETIKATANAPSRLKPVNAISGELSNITVATVD
jgi:hypothetical protein